MTKYWKHLEIFPHIARLIEQEQPLDGDYIDQETLVAAMLEDTESERIIKRAAQKSGESAAVIAVNMIAFFSKKYTENPNGTVDFEYPRYIERVRPRRSGGGRRYRYRMKLDDYRTRSELYAGEVSDASRFLEGAMISKYVNAYERDQAAREKCISYYGKECTVCLKTLEEVYGSIAKDLIHVHHLRPLSKIGQAYQVNPIEDLCPVCPNCHAVIHLNDPPFTIPQARALMADAKAKSEKR